MNKNSDTDNEKESLMKKILEKDREISQLKEKLLMYPFELKDGEKLMTVNFVPFDKKIQN